MPEEATQDNPDIHETHITQDQSDPLIANVGGQEQTPVQPPEEMLEALQELTQIIQPVLEKLFNAAQTDSDLWLKKKEVKILTDWQLITARQLDAMQQMLASQPSRKLWQPGI